MLAKVTYIYNVNHKYNYIIIYIIHITSYDKYHILKSIYCHIVNQILYTKINNIFKQMFVIPIWSMLLQDASSRG